MLLAQRCELAPQRGGFRQRREGPRRAQLEHLPDLEQLQREAGGEALEHPAGVRPLLDQAEALEAVEELADAGGRHAELAGQFELVDHASPAAHCRAASIP